MGERIRAFDWSGTPLGPLAGWPQSLRTAVRIMLTSRQPIWIGWGDQLLYLYNDPYKSIIGGKHPWALARPAKEVWREIWPNIGPMLATAMGGDEGTYVEAQLLIMERSTDQRDLPFALIYFADPDGKSLSLVGWTPLGRLHSAFPKTIAINEATPWPLAEGDRRPDRACSRQFGSAIR
jgi:hypothetical protein